MKTGVHKYPIIEGETAEERRLRLKRAAAARRYAADKQGLPRKRLPQNKRTPKVVLPRIERVGNKTIHRCITMEED